MSFTDPVTKIEGYGAFKALMDATRFFFKASFEVHSVEITGPANITTKYHHALDPICCLPLSSCGCGLPRECFQNLRLIQPCSGRWAMYLKQEQLPWQPSVVLTGKTFYTIDIEKKQVLSHVDEWDSASHNTFFSVRCCVTPPPMLFMSRLSFPVASSVPTAVL